jgi:hypothetical protein
MFMMMGNSTSGFVNAGTKKFSISTRLIPKREGRTDGRDNLSCFYHFRSLSYRAPRRILAVRNKQGCDAWHSLWSRLWHNSCRGAHRIKTQMKEKHEIIFNSPFFAEEGLFLFSKKG